MINTNYTNRKTCDGGDANNDTREITAVSQLPLTQTQPTIDQSTANQPAVSISSSGDMIDGQMDETSLHNNVGQTQLIK